MKKLFIALVTIMSMMLCIASPLFVRPLKANAALPSFVNEPQPIFEDMWSEPINNENYVYSYNKLLAFFSNTYVHNIPNSANYFSMTYKQKTPSSYDYQNMCFWYDSADVSIDGNHIIIQNMVNGSICSQCTYDNVQVIQNDVGKVDFDFDTFTFQFWDRSGDTYDLRYLYQSSWPVTDIWNVYTNIDSLSAPSLDLEVTFSPSMSGTVTRQGTANGSSVTYNYLDLNIQNHGYNAQWLFAIVPHGQSLTFPESILNSPQGFNGSPTYVYIADEWIDWTNGLTGMTGNYGGIDMEMLYSPCAWHTLITQSDRTYHINWDMMKLSKNVSYDCVVYGMINEEPVNASSSGSGLGCWTVKSALSDVQEVYRSTFTMPNPPEFNPNSVDEGNMSHSWDPDVDNTDLFNHGSVYKDANGNLVIKGSSWSSDGSAGSFYSGSGNPINVNQAFGNTFGFFNGLLNLLPRDYRLVIFFGVVAIVAIAIIKAVK